MNTQQIVTFNTGRQYNLKGQRIAAVRLADGRVMFADVDRGLDGITNMQYRPFEHNNDAMLKEFVMNEYDSGFITYGYYAYSEDWKVREHEGFALMQALKDAANAI